VLSLANPRTVAAPAGWTSVTQQTSGTGPQTLVYARVAAAGDAGDPVTLNWTGGTTKSTLQLLAYDGTTAAVVSAFASAARLSGTSHTTPTVANAPAGSWVLSVWSDKQSATRSWTPPAGVAERSDVTAPGTGAVATMVADSNGPVSGGTVGGLTATVPTASNRATVFTLVLAPGA
jgi:hypothetical protein